MTNRKQIHKTVANNESELLDVIGDIYQAGLEPDRWPVLLKRLSFLFEADLACIYTPVVAYPEQAIYISHNFSESMRAAYQSYYNELDTWTQTSLNRGIYVQGTVAFGEQLVPPRELHRTEFYNDFLKPNGLEWMVTTAIFDGRTVPGTSATHMTFSRHPDHGAFESDKAHLIEVLAPHVRRALHTHWQLTSARLMLHNQSVAMDQTGHGVLLLDSNGKVLHMNRVAEMIIQSGEGLAIQSGTLKALSPVDQEALVNLVREASLGLGGGICVSRGNAHSRHNAQANIQPYCLSATPLREGQNLMVHEPQGIVLRPGLMLTIHVPGKNSKDNALDTYVAHHHITPAESRVLRLLIDDMAPKQIAAHLDVSVRTIRTQLSSLFNKTGTRNQRQLLKAVTGYLGS